MLWYVETSVRLSYRDRYALIIYSTSLRMIVKVSTTAQIEKKKTCFILSKMHYIPSIKKQIKH